MIRKCKRCGSELANNYYKWCDNCLMAKWESAKGQEKSMLFKLLEMRGFKVEYKKRCSCGVLLDNNKQKQCTECLFDEMADLVKMGTVMYRYASIYETLRKRGYSKPQVDKIVMERLRK